MIPGNVDPRRPDKVQRYKPAASGNGNAPGEDLTPDYMNILGPDSTTGNVPGDSKVSENIKNVEAKPSSNLQQQNVQARDDASKTKPEAAPAITTNASNVIPTSPQYGVAIIPTTTTTNDIPAEATTPATDTITESTPKTSETENKDIHSTPSKNDRFKVVKIASSEPFRRGRWKCMDFVDQTPPVTAQQTKTTTQGSTTSVQMAGNVYLQTQSLPPHQIQQLLLQGALTAVPPQFYQGNLQSQVVPQTQYFYPAVQTQGNVQQILNPGVVPSNSMQPQFVNPTQQQYFQPAVIPQNFQNVQFVQQAYQNQNSAFVPTTQNIQNFQQAQTYAGQPTVTQQNVVQGQSQPIPVTQPQPMVNGFAYSPQNITEQQIAANNLPTQVAKNVILNSNPPVTQVVQNQVVQNQQTMPIQNQESQSVSQNSVPRTVPMQNQQLPPEQNQSYQQIPQHMNPVLQNINPLQNVVVLQAYDPNQSTDVYTNPQFVASVHSLPIMEASDVHPPEGAVEISQDALGNLDDPAKTNPVVNAIDNKIEQAMDLVKSHLMYTVREEVEVLKEKIAELMERIQQLESENNFLRSQIPKNNPNSNGTSEPSPQQ